LNAFALKIAGAISPGRISFVLSYLANNNLTEMNILSSNYLISSPNYRICPPADRPEYAFIGRSNVGKSSLINMLCNKKDLAKTSANPGKTQLINHFDIESSADSSKKDSHQKWYLVDLPGYGFAKVSISQRKKWERMIEDYLRLRENLINTFVLIDSRLNPQKLDLDFINRLGAWQIPFTLVFTKADKESQKQVSQHVNEFLRALKVNWQILPNYVVTSTIKRMGRTKILEEISGWNKEYEKIDKRK
jgi:GTP-binding protein